jgi:hypothetical protein
MRHRLVLVREAPQLLPVTGHDQEAVVRPGSEHEHDQEARRLPVDLERAGLDQPVDGGGRDPVGDGDDEEGNQGDHRRAVDREQENEDQGDRDEEQGGVDRLEDLDRIADDPGDAADVRPQLAGGRVVVGRDLADRLDVVLDQLGIGRVGTDEQDGRRAVLGDRRRRGLGIGLAPRIRLGDRFGGLGRRRVGLELLRAADRAAERIDNREETDDIRRRAVQARIQAHAEGRLARSRPIAFRMRLDPRDRERVGTDPPLVRLGESAIALIDDERVELPAVGEELGVFQQVVDLGRLGVLGQERLVLVRRRVLELGLKSEQPEAEEDPERDHQPLRSAAGGEARNGSEHRRVIVTRPL